MCSGQFKENRHFNLIYLCNLLFIAVTDSYCMYLFRPCEINLQNHNLFFKGRFVEGTIADLKQGFDAWQAAQKDFVKIHQDKVDIL